MPLQYLQADDDLLQKIITPASGITSTYPASVAVWLTIATKIIEGVSNFLGVTLSINLRPVLIKPECSATPTPSIATSTTPSGAKPVNVFTIEDKKVANESLASMLLIIMASPVRGSIASNVTLENHQDKNRLITWQTKR